MHELKYLNKKLNPEIMQSLYSVLTEDIAGRCPQHLCPSKEMKSSISSVCYVLGFCKHLNL